MPFIQKWIFSGCTIFMLFFILSTLSSIIREIPLHPEIIFSKNYKERRRRNFLGWIAIFFTLSIVLGAIFAVGWEEYNYIFTEAVYGPLFYLLIINFSNFFKISLLTSSMLGVPSTSISSPLFL